MWLVAVDVEPELEKAIIPRRNRTVQHDRRCQRVEVLGLRHREVFEQEGSGIDGAQGNLVL